jgi:(p)ppGpp synthase/HD superfamily hydrolase
VMLEQRIGEKFGRDVLETVLAVTYRREDESGVEFSGPDKKADYLNRLLSASESARWVCAADKLHNAASILADLDRTMEAETIWSRFGGGRQATVTWYREVYDRLEEVGFRAEIMQELGRVTAELESRR